MAVKKDKLEGEAEVAVAAVARLAGIILWSKSDRVAMLACKRSDCLPCDQQHVCRLQRLWGREVAHAE